MADLDLEQIKRDAAEHVCDVRDTRMACDVVPYCIAGPVIRQLVEEVERLRAEIDRLQEGPIAYA